MTTRLLAFSPDGRTFRRGAVAFTVLKHLPGTRRTRALWDGRKTGRLAHTALYTRNAAHAAVGGTAPMDMVRFAFHTYHSVIPHPPADFTWA